MVSTPLKHISQMGLLFPIYGKKCSKSPTSSDIYPLVNIQRTMEITISMGKSLIQQAMFNSHVRFPESNQVDMIWVLSENMGFIPPNGNCIGKNDDHHSN
jgi:hypothetical protein